MRRVWFARFSRASSEHAICVRPTWTVCDDDDEDFESEAEPAPSDDDDAFRGARFFMLARS
jgi:hypothetical protein